MSERGDDLRTTAEDVAADAERLKEIEETKAVLPEDHPDVIPLSEEAAELGEAIAAKTKAELAIANEG